MLTTKIITQQKKNIHNTNTVGLSAILAFVAKWTKKGEFLSMC